MSSHGKAGCFLILDILVRQLKANFQNHGLSDALPRASSRLWRYNHATSATKMSHTQALSFCAGLTSLDLTQLLLASTLNIVEQLKA